MSGSLEELISGLRADYAAKRPRSAEAYQRALDVMPGGNSRTQLYFEPFPFYIDRAEGPYLYDVDGHRYLDVVNNYTSLIHGHPDPEFIRAISEQAGRGTAFAAPSPLEIELADEIISRVPGIESVRFTNSGTEAVMYALRLARHVTGRSDIIKAEGGYHGGSEPVQVSVKKLGSHPTVAVGEEGVPPEFVGHTRVIPYDDTHAAVQVIRDSGTSAAALILEPLQGFGGAIRPPDGYIQAVSEAAQEQGVLVVLDEIQTLRLGYGGLQEDLGITPDLTVLGKLIGGGLPVGAFGGRADVMSHSDPRANRGMTQSGTFNANPLTMAAGLHTIRKLTRERIVALNRQGDELRDWIGAQAGLRGLPLVVTGYGSLLQIHVGSKQPTSYRDASARPKAPLTALFHLLMERGVFTAPSRIIFALSTAIGTDQEELIRSALGESLDPLAQVDL
ncbi:MAG: aspartate aminotransferase family protein [Acidimicrobiia bacterium]